MALQLGALRTALIDAGASDETANKAAEEMAGYDRELVAIRADLLILKWGQGVTIAAALAILVKLFIH